MKKTILALLLILPLLASCQTEEQEYYIRYEAAYAEWTAGPDKMLTYTVATPDGPLQVLGGSAFEYTCGPVTRGFKAEIQIEGGDWNRCVTRIFVATKEAGVYTKCAQGGAYSSCTVPQW